MIHVYEEFKATLLKIECAYKYTHNASFIDARAAPEDSFVEGIKRACLEKGFFPISRDLHS